MLDFRLRLPLGPKRTSTSAYFFNLRGLPLIQFLNSRVPPTKVLLVRGRLFYGRAMLQWHSKEIAVGLPPKRNDPLVLFVGFFHMVAWFFFSDISTA
jgi:hypothetical protein